MAVSIMIPKTVMMGPGLQDASMLGVASGAGISITMVVLSTVIVFVMVEVLIISIVSVVVTVILMVGVTTIALVLIVCMCGAATSFPVITVLKHGTIRSCGTALDLEDVFHPVTITVIALPNKSRHIQARIGHLRPGLGKLFKGNEASVQHEKLTIRMPNELTAAFSIILSPESRLWPGCAVAPDAANWIKSASVGATLLSMHGIRILVMYH